MAEAGGFNASVSRPFTITYICNIIIFIYYSGLKFFMEREGVLVIRSHYLHLYSSGSTTI